MFASAAVTLCVEIACGGYVDLVTSESADTERCALLGGRWGWRISIGCLFITLITAAFWIGVAREAPGVLTAAVCLAGGTVLYRLTGAWCAALRHTQLLAIGIDLAPNALFAIAVVLPGQLGATDAPGAAQLLGVRSLFLGVSCGLCAVWLVRAHGLERSGLHERDDLRAFWRLTGARAVAAAQFRSDVAVGGALQGSEAIAFYALARRSLDAAQVPAFAARTVVTPQLAALATATEAQGRYITRVVRESSVVALGGIALAVVALTMNPGSWLPEGAHMSLNVVLVLAAATAQNVLSGPVSPALALSRADRELSRVHGTTLIPVVLGIVCGFSISLTAGAIAYAVAVFAVNFMLWQSVWKVYGVDVSVAGRRYD